MSVHGSLYSSLWLLGATCVALPDSMQPLSSVLGCLRYLAGFIPDVEEKVPEAQRG